MKKQNTFKRLDKNRKYRYYSNGKRISAKEYLRRQRISRSLKKYYQDIKKPIKQPTQKPKPQKQETVEYEVKKVKFDNGVKGVDYIFYYDKQIFTIDDIVKELEWIKTLKFIKYKSYTFAFFYVRYDVVRGGEVILEGRFSTEYISIDELYEIGLEEVQEETFNENRIASDDLEEVDFIFLTSITVGLRKE